MPERDARVRALNLRGVGDEAFSAGADIEELAELLQDRALLDDNKPVVQRAQIALQEFSKPSVAMVRGAVFGGFCGIDVPCDSRLAEQNARIGITPAKLGLLYSVRDTRRLYRLVGISVTRGMLFAGAALSAAEALQVGLVDQL